MPKMKIIAKYLPQFHRTAENDQWWGEGFTEWTAVKNAAPLFTGHKQPIRPMHDNYYNLLDKEVMAWQAELMHRYDIDGMCFYHYWFQNEKMILETPAENLLKWHDIDMPFCFCWANESWIRTWSNAGNGNAWVMNDCSRIKLSDSGILLEQGYGGRKEWKKHFQYLLPFFKDDRYIRLDGKPVFLIYKPLSMPCVFNMIAYWRELAKRSGLDGIYFIGENLDEKYNFDAQLLGEPSYIFHKYFEGQQVISYQDAISAEVMDEETVDTYYGAFSNYDNSPRMGKKGNIVVGGTPRLFQEQLEAMLKKNAANGNSLLFVNAWNEWAEGMYLEPDADNGEAWLQSVKQAKMDYLSKKTTKFAKIMPSPSANNALLRKYDMFWHILDKWLKIKEAGRKVTSYFTDHDIKHVAIYGCGMLGRHILNELEAENFIVDYLIDLKAEYIDAPYEVYSPESELPSTEIIVVTVPDAYPKIYIHLNDKVNAPVISIEEVIMWVKI